MRTSSLRRDHFTRTGMSLSRMSVGLAGYPTFGRKFFPGGTIASLDGAEIIQFLDRRADSQSSNLEAKHDDRNNLANR